MRIDLSRAAFLVLCLALAASALAQTTVQLQQGLNNYSGTTDTDMSSAAPTSNRGSAGNVLIGSSGSMGLMRFAIFVSEGGPVPDGATITNATLYAFQISGPDAVLQAQRLLRGWSETQATWNVAATGVPWQIAGAQGTTDIVVTPDGQAASSVSTGWFGIDVTASVQAFAGGAPNYGWKISWVSGGTATKEWVSHDNVDSMGIRPELDVTYTAPAACASGPFNGTPAQVPGTFEAEDFDCGGEGAAYHDNTPGNQSTSTYRNPESVDVMDMAAGGRTVQFFDTGEWMKYTINVPVGGNFDLAINAASNQVPAGQLAGQYRIEVDGADVTGNVNVLSTGSWDLYQWVTGRTNLPLTAGTHTVKLFSVHQSYRVDQLRLVQSAGCASGPFNGTPAQVPGTFEAENFDCGGEGVGYHDNTPGNQSTSTYRNPESVDVMDMVGGGRTVQFFDTGEWMAYSISVAAAGNYSLGIFAASNQVAAGQVAGQYRIEIDGVDRTGNVNVLSTGSWDTYAWTDASAAVSLTAGRHTLRLVSALQSYRVDKLRIVPLGAGDCSTPGLTLCIQFEAAPDTTFSGTLVTSRTLGSSITWFAQNANADSATDTNRISLVAGGRDGSSALQLQTLDNDSNVHSSGSSERSEIEMTQADTNAVNGTEQWWAQSVFIPTTSVLPSANWEGSSIMQFHGSGGGAPNFMIAWLNQGSVAAHPIFRAYTGGEGGFDSIGTQYRYTIGTDPNPVIGQCILDNPQKGVWYDFVHRIKWSYSGQGEHEIWMRQAGGPVTKVLRKVGINTLYLNDSAYLKMGPYHDPVLGANTAIIYDRIRRGSSADAVRMSDFTVDPNASVTMCANTQVAPGSP
jgi:hypothetical protein